ncbi:MAG: type III pantothenate kinase [Gammaproteobacteria bacterium]|nr:type III pantothenate kinase [Gammaproteobacteria bacterium]
MLLDIGNTNLKWCLFYEGRFDTIHSVSHRDRSFSDVADECWSGIAPPTDIIVSNVAGHAMHGALQQWVQDNWNLEPYFVEAHDCAFGVKNGYRTPGQLGVDRWLTLIAVHNRLNQSACIVDCGTAVTIDVLQADGLHKGGLILPGFNLMRESLLDRTHIPRVSVALESPLLGTDTETAVASASLHATAALIERVMDYMSVQLNGPIVLVMTGSDAPRMRTLLKVESQVIPDLVISGLALIARERTP